VLAKLNQLPGLSLEEVQKWKEEMWEKYRRGKK